MGNVQSEPSAGGGSRKEQALDRVSDSRRVSLVEPEVTPSSPAMRLARGLGGWLPGSSTPPCLLVPPEPQASPSPLPLPLERPSPVPPPTEAAAAPVSTPPPPPVGTLLPAPSKWRKPTGTPVPRIRGLLEASHRGQGDPLSLRPLPPRPRQLTQENPAPAAAAALAPQPSLSLEARKPPPPPPPPPPQPPPPPPDRQPLDRRISRALVAPAPSATDSKAGSENRAAGWARGGAPPEAGGGEMARPAASESGLSLLCKVTFKSGPPLPPAAATGSLGAKASLGAGGGGGLFSATSGAISYAEVLKQGALAPATTRPSPSGEASRGSQEAEGGDGDGEACSRLPSAPVTHGRTLPPPPYTTLPGSKPKFDWMSPPDGSERHFGFNAAGGGVGPPRRRATALSGPWGSLPPPPPPPPLPPLPTPPLGQTQPAPGPRRPAPALLAPPMFIFPAPTNGEPRRPGSAGQQAVPPPPTPPPTPPSPPTPQPLQPTPAPAAVLPAPSPGPVEPAQAPHQVPTPSPALTADQVPTRALTPAPAAAPSPTPAPTIAEPPLPVLVPVKTRTRRSKGPRAARGATREDGAPGDGPRARILVNPTDSTAGGGSGPLAAGAATSGAARHWPPFQVLNSCPCKCYCRHQPRHRRLPQNVSAWLSTPTNHLREPPWVATIKLAGALVAGLEHYDLQATHSK
ncbi:gametogenetin [Tenrec ecaudatus]|uniref:gametogenetin n=1 Tax=Tenrec ecaudatus TaxID=94439 RepID=UPI003F59F1EA